MISYAQNGEDVLLQRVFPHADGFYLDIGAAHPFELSVTKWFYDRGWSGVNVEPQPGYFALLSADRPRDLNLQLVVSDRAGEMTFYELPDKPGWATTDAATAEQLRADGEDVRERTVRAVTLADLCDRHAARPIDFLKIDVEGAERAVLAGGDFARHRPRVMVIEATEVGKPTLNHDTWEPLVFAADYRFAFFDGLNRYYVRAEDEALIPTLAVPVNVFDAVTPHPWLALTQNLERLLADARHEAARHAAEAAHQAAESARHAHDADRRADEAARRAADLDGRLAAAAADLDAARRHAAGDAQALDDLRRAFAALKAGTVPRAAHDAARGTLAAARRHLHLLREHLDAGE